MSSEKRTSGPWDADFRTEVDGQTRLNGAASDMLAALHALCDGDASYHEGEIRIQCADHGDALRRMREARAAIAKAEGR